MELAVDQATLREMMDSEIPTLSDYAVGFAMPNTQSGSVDASLGGSGTLVSVDQVYGILTANHVLELLKKSTFVGLILPSRFGAKIHNLSFGMGQCSFVEFSSNGEPSDGPDLALLVPPPDVLSALKAIKTFYNLSMRQKRMLDARPTADLGLWILSGLAGEWVSDLQPEMGFARVKLFKGMHGLGKVTREYNRGNFDYLICEALYNSSYEGPTSFGGFSGGGLWQVLVRPGRNKIKITDRLLAGVAFYQSAKVENAGQTTREIICHGPRSVYEVLISAVRPKST